MLDPHLFRDNLDAVTEGLKNRGDAISIDPFQEMDEKRRNLLGQVEDSNATATPVPKRSARS